MNDMERAKQAMSVAAEATLAGSPDAVQLAEHALKLLLAAQAELAEQAEHERRREDG
jgi:hypothetical protein